MIVLAPSTDVTCAVEVFIATALLHYEQPNRPEFTIQEIVRRATQENITGEMRSGVNVHASQHCVANKAPNPNRHKMLYASGKNTRRLLLPDDHIHPARTGKIFPEAGEVPERYLALLSWAKERFNEYGRAHNKDFPAGNLHQVQSVFKRTHLRDLIDAKGIGIEPPGTTNFSGDGQAKEEEPGVWFGELLKLRLAGAHLADGVDPDEHVRQLREGWD